MKSETPAKITMSALLLAPLLWSVCVGNAAPKSSSARATGAEHEEDARKLFAGYPKSRAFDSFVGEHLNAKLRLKNNDLLWSTWFYGWPHSTAQESIVSSDGQTMKRRNVYDWAIQAQSAHQLSAWEKREMKRLLSGLPSSAKQPPLEDLMILSFRRDNRWITRIYNRKRLPQAVTRIYELMGVSLR